MLWRRLLFAMLGLLIAACTVFGSATDEQPSDTSLPPNGMCRPGSLLLPGESCTHTFSRLSSAATSNLGETPSYERVTRTFHVDFEGVGHYGDSLSGFRIDYASGSGDYAVRFVAYATEEGSFYIDVVMPAEVMTST